MQNDQPPFDFGEIRRQRNRELRDMALRQQGEAMGNILRQSLTDLSGYASTMAGSLGVTQQVYVVDAAGHGIPMSRRTLAAVSSVNDLIAREQLDADGRWRGRGLCVGFNSTAILDEYKTLSVDFIRSLLLGLFCHELAHAIAGVFSYQTFNAPSIDPELIVGVVSRWRAESIVEDTEGLAPPRVIPPWDGAHGPDWCRASLHASARAKRLGNTLSRQFSVPSGFDQQQLLSALGTEVTATAPLAEILATDPPAEFCRVWQGQVDAWHKRQAEQTAATTVGQFWPIDLSPSAGVHSMSTVFEKIRSAIRNRKQAVAKNYTGIILDMAKAKELDPEVVAEVLEAEGRTLEEAEAEVERVRERIRRQDTLREQRKVASKLESARSKLQAKQEELKRVTEELERQMVPLEVDFVKASEATAAVGWAQDALASACKDPILLERGKEIDAESYSIGKKMEHLLVLMNERRKWIAENTEKLKNEHRYERQSVTYMRNSLPIWRDEIAAYASEHQELSDRRAALQRERKEIHDRMIESEF